MGDLLTTSTSVARFIDDASALGAKFMVDQHWAGVRFWLPRTFPQEMREALKENQAPIRLIVKLRVLSTWLNVDHAAFMHGDTATTGEEFGKWLDVFGGSDRLVRWLYPCDDCIWGARGCNPASDTGDSVALCETCADRGEV